MAFTGVAVRQGNSTRFGVDSVGSTPRAFVSFNGEPYVITRDGLIHITDLANGSGVLIQNNSGYNLSSPDPTCGFAYNSRLYFLDRGGNTLQRFDDPLTGDVSLIDFYTGITSPSGAASDGTTVWVYDSSFDALHTINPDTAVTTLLGTVGFDVTTPANGIGGMFYHGGKLYLLDNGTELMFVIDDPSAATLEATAVDVNVVEFGASQRGVNGGSVHDGEAYMAGGNPDALYRFYNVRWDETIAAVEVDAGGNGSLDLSTVSKDATSFVFVPGYTAPSWLTISGNDLVVTGAPDVTSDTDYSPEVRAVRGSFHEDETLTVRVAVAGPTIVPSSVPRSLLFSTFENSIVVSWDEASDNGGESPTHYDVRIDGGSWISTGLDTFYAFGSLSPATEYTIEVAQVNSAGRGAIASGTATTNSVPIVVPGAPTSLSLSETHSSIVAAWAAANDNGGEDPTRYDIRIDGGAWIDTGLDLTHAFSNLSAETEYTVEVAQVNSAGRGTAVSATVTTDAAPIVITTPGAPRSLSLTETHNSIVATWAAANDNGGESPIRYDIRIDGGSWIDTGLDLMHTFSSLSAETEYTIEVAQVNSVGRGTAVSGTVTTDAAPIVIAIPGAPRSLSLSETHNSIVATWRAAANNGGESPTRYDIRINSGAWINAGLDLSHTFSGLSPDTQYTVDVAQVNSAGRGADVTRSITTDAAPIVITTPGAPRSLSLTETHNRIVAVWRAAANNGGEAPSRYDIRINGGSWVNAGLDLTHVFENLSPETQYLIQVAAVNSAGRGATASAIITTDAAPVVITVPGVPTSLSLTETHNSIVATWAAAANNGGESPTHYDIRIDSGAWIDTGLDLAHVFQSLSADTQYTIYVAQVNSAGRGASVSATVTTDAAPIVITVPSAPRSLSLTATHNRIVAVWRAAANNGGEAPSRYDIRINGGQWIDTDLDLRHTFENLSPTTQYLIEVAEVNSAGRGTTASKSVRTDAAPVVITAPAVPRNLTVELTATTAILKWAVPGTGSPPDSYEVSYAEGDSVGSDWIDTESLRTRFFIRRLKRGTQYTFGVRGRNSAGAGDASRPVTQNTPIASLHNALFFKECVNYFDRGARVSVHGNPSELVRAVADNNYKTYTREKDLVINIAVGGNPTRVDAILVKGKGITRHSGAPTGGSGSGWTDVDLPSTVKNWEGTDVSTTVLGFQHHLLLLDSHFTATSVRVRFQGTNVEIYEILLLEFLLEIDANGDFTDISPDYVDRSAVIHPSPGGGVQRSSSLGAERPKWETSYVVKIVPGKTLLESVDEFVYQMGENPNIVHAQEPSRYPARIHPASFLLKRVPTRLRSDDKLQGDVVQFRVGEQ